MISQMREHHQKIEKILRNLPVQGQQWQMWLNYHEYQVSYFQKNREAYLLLADVLILAMLVSLAGAVVYVSFELWIVTALLACGLVGCGYYLFIYNELLHLMEEQTVLLFEKTLAIEMKPNLTMARYAFDFAGSLVSSLARRARMRRERDAD